MSETTNQEIKPKSAYECGLELLEAFRSEDQGIKDSFHSKPEKRFERWVKVLWKDFPDDQKPMAAAFVAAIVSHNG